MLCRTVLGNANTHPAAAPPRPHPTPTASIRKVFQQPFCLSQTGNGQPSSVNMDCLLLLGGGVAMALVGEGGGPCRILFCPIPSVGHLSGAQRGCCQMAEEGRLQMPCQAEWGSSHIDQADYYPETAKLHVRSFNNIGPLHNSRPNSASTFDSMHVRNV